MTTSGPGFVHEGRRYDSPAEVIAELKAEIEKLKGDVCEHEEELREDGFVPEITITVWAKKGFEERQMHYHGPDTIMDLACLIRYLNEKVIGIEEDRETHE